MAALKVLHDATGCIYKGDKKCASNCSEVENFAFLVQAAQLCCSAEFGSAATCKPRCIIQATISTNASQVFSPFSAISVLALAGLKTN